MSEISVVIEGVRSPLLEFGPPEANEAVVFVHGTPGSRRDWENLARGVSEFGRAAAMDMPGFGTADKPVDFDCSGPVFIPLFDSNGKRSHYIEEFATIAQIVSFNILASEGHAAVAMLWSKGDDQ